MGLNSSFEFFIYALLKTKLEAHRLAFAITACMLA